jgi:ubiquinone/menaquinone biosynthesis C-methylase UbiE
MNKVIDHAARALAAGGRFVIVEFKKPEKWLLWLAKLGILITKPFGEIYEAERPERL